MDASSFGCVVILSLYLTLHFVNSSLIDGILKKYFYLIRPYFGLSYGNVSVVRLKSVDGKMADECWSGEFWTEVVLFKEWPGSNRKMSQRNEKITRTIRFQTEASRMQV